MFSVDNDVSNFHLFLFLIEKVYEVYKGKEIIILLFDCLDDLTVTFLDLKSSIFNIFQRLV